MSMKKILLPNNLQKSQNGIFLKKFLIFKIYQNPFQNKIFSFFIKSLKKPEAKREIIVCKF